MKKTSIIAGALVLAGTFSAYKASSQVYVQLNGGYSLGIGEYGYVSNVDYQHYPNAPDVKTITPVKFSLGKGVNFGGAVGLMFSKKVGFEVGVDYLMGGKTKTTYVDFFGEGSSDNTTYTNTYSSTMIRVMPALVIRAGGGDRDRSLVHPYAKFGITIGMGKYIENEERNDAFGVTITETEFSKGLAIGFNSSVGVQFTMSRSLSFFTELRYIGLNYAPKNGDVIRFTLNGEDQSSRLRTYDKQTEYSNKVVDEGDGADTSKPRQQERIGSPFSSLGANVGLKISF